MPEGKDTLETVVTTKEGEGSGVFEKIRYTKVGEYKYTVKEQVPEDKRPGMTYDENEYTVTVKVTDDLNGKLVMAQSVEDNQISVNASRLATGSYFLRLSDGKNSVTTKFVKR